MYDLIHVDIYLTINAFEWEPQENFPCGFVSYDDCIQNNRKGLNTSCKLPFENVEDLETPICSTLEDGKFVVEQIRNNSYNCLRPCTLLNIDVKEVPKTYMVTKARNDFMSKLVNEYKFKTGYRIHIPNEGDIISSVHDYGFISYIAEFGGWSGLLVGASLLQIFDICFGSLEIKKSMQRVKRISILFLNLASLIYIINLVFACTVKYFDDPHGIMVNFEKTQYDFDISVCSPKYTIEFSRHANGKH